MQRPKLSESCIGRSATNLCRDGSVRAPCKIRTGHCFSCVDPLQKRLYWRNTIMRLLHYTYFFCICNFFYWFPCSFCQKHELVIESIYSPVIISMNSVTDNYSILLSFLSNVNISNSIGLTFLSFVFHTTFNLHFALPVQVHGLTQVRKVARDHSCVFANWQSLRIQALALYRVDD